MDAMSRCGLLSRTAFAAAAAQIEAVRSVVESPESFVQIVQGPPGTGRSVGKGGCMVCLPLTLRMVMVSMLNTCLVLPPVPHLRENERHHEGSGSLDHESWTGTAGPWRKRSPDGVLRKIQRRCTEHGTLPVQESECEEPVQV